MISFLVFVTFCVSFVFALICIHILYLCAVCRKVIEPHDTSGSSHNLLRLLSNSTPHRSKPTLSLPQYRGIQNTEYGGIQNTEEYLQKHEPAMKQSTVIIKFNLTSIWCHVAVLRTTRLYRILNHMYCENQSVVLQSSRIPRRRTKDEARH